MRFKLQRPRLVAILAAVAIATVGLGCGVSAQKAAANATATNVYSPTSSNEVLAYTGLFVSSMPAVQMAP